LHVKVDPEPAGTAGDVSEETGMDDGTGVTGDTDPDDGISLDVREAAQIMAAARENALRQLGFRHPAMYVTWGLIYLLGYGGLWLSVRGQHPYHAPSPTAILAVFLLAAVGLGVTATLVDRSSHGVSGVSAVQRHLTFLALGAGYLGVLILEGAVQHAGVSQSAVGVMEAVCPFLVVGVVFVAASAADQDWTTAGLGLWLIAAAAFSGFAGPAAVWGVLGLAAGCGFLAMVPVVVRRNRRAVGPA
jgi:hypothetical protein